MKAKNLTFSEIYDLYIVKNLSILEVCEQLAVGKTTFHRYLRKFRIKKSKNAAFSCYESSCLKKYGVKHPSKLEKVKKATRTTNFKKYGKEYIFQVKEIKEKIKKTHLERLNVDNPAKSKTIKTKIKENNLKKYGEKNVMQVKSVKEKVITTNLDKYKVKNVFQDEKVKEKIKRTNQKHWGVDNPSQNEQIKLKKIATHHKNKSFNTSSFEKEVYERLKNKYKEVYSQYITTRYPFRCDFYIKDIDCFIEIQGLWTHGGKPFEGTLIDLMKLDQWKQKSMTSKFYADAIKTWTERDVIKRQFAIQNKLNFFEFFTKKDFYFWLNL